MTLFCLVFQMKTIIEDRLRSALSAILTQMVKLRTLSRLKVQISANIVEVSASRKKWRLTDQINTKLKLNSIKEV